MNIQALYDRRYKLICVSEMDSDPDRAIVAELDEIQNKLSSFAKQTENAFDILDNRMKAWSIRRHDVLKAGTEKVLQVLSERDYVSLAKFAPPPPIIHFTKLIQSHTLHFSSRPTHPLNSFRVQLKSS